MPVEMRFRLPKDIPIEEYPKPETYLDEAQRLINEAQNQDMILRVMGPIALHYYFPEYVDLYRQLDRLGERVFTDIDYASYGKFRGKLVPFFQKQGYELEKRAAMLSGNTRHIYFGERIPMIDVFYDRLAYNHPIEYKGRLEIHPLCVSLTDLLLQKLQIVQITEKDLKDSMLLLLCASVGDADNKVINAVYLAKIMSDDWGFYHTSVTNLGKIKQALQGVSVLSEQQRLTIQSRVDQLVQLLDNSPKTGNWKRRAKIGISKPWYNDVSDWS